jgi:hypothetical protein
MEYWNIGMMGVFSKHIIPFFQYSIIPVLNDEHGIAVTIKLVFSANGFLICLH